MNALVTGGIIDRLKHLPGQRTTGRKLTRRLARTTSRLVSELAATDKQAISICATALVLAQGTPCKEQVHVRGLQQVIIHFVEIHDRPNDVRADMALVGEALQPSPDTHVRIQLEIGIGVVLLVHVDPLFYLDLAGAVVNLKGDVGGLRVDVADLADKGDLRDGRVVDLEVGACVGFFCFEDLLDCDGAEGFILVRLLGNELDTRLHVLGLFFLWSQRQNRPGEEESKGSMTDLAAELAALL